MPKYGASSLIHSTGNSTIPVAAPSSTSSYGSSGHQRGVVGELELPDQGERGGAEIPRRDADAHRWPAPDFGEGLVRPVHQIALDGRRELARHLVDPSVHGELVSLI